MNPRLRPWQGRTLPLSYSRSEPFHYSGTPKHRSIRALGLIANDSTREPETSSAGAAGSQKSVLKIRMHSIQNVNFVLGCDSRISLIKPSGACRRLWGKGSSSSRAMEEFELSRPVCSERTTDAGSNIQARTTTRTRALRSATRTRRLRHRVCSERPWGEEPRTTA